MITKKDLVSFLLGLNVFWGAVTAVLVGSGILATLPLTICVAIAAGLAAVAALVHQGSSTT